MRNFYLILLSYFFACSTSENQTNQISYHFFSQNGKIGIVDSEGNITCEPKFDNQVFYPTEFNNLNHAKFTSIYNDQKYSSHIIDINGNEPFPDNKKIGYSNHGDLAIYFDNFSTNKGLHVVSLKDRKEIGYYENGGGINFYGNTKYFYSLIENSKWQLFNGRGELIYEKGYPMEVDVLEPNNNFEAIVISRRGTRMEYLDSNGKKLPSNKSLDKLFNSLQKQKEIEFNKEHPKHNYPSFLQ